MKCYLCNGTMEYLIEDWQICPSCDLAKRTKPQVQSKSEIYTKEWVIQHSNDKVNKDRVKYETSILKGMVAKGERTLDIGCGSGTLVHELANLGCKAEGIDSSPIAIEIASKGRGYFHLGDASLSAIKYGRYKLITATHLLEHLPDPTICLLGIHRLLFNYGFVYLAVPNLDSYKEKSLWRGASRGSLFAPDHEFCYSPRSLTKILENCGFSILKYWTRTFSPTILRQCAVTLYHRNKPDTTIAPKLSRMACNDLSLNPIVDTIMAIPNWLSARNNRGEELIVIAKRV